MSLKHLTKKQHCILTFSVLFVVVLLISLILLSNRAFAQEGEKENAQSSSWETALINSYTNRIQLAVTAYYQDDRILAPSYTIRLKSVTLDTKEGTENTSAEITFIVQPYMGSHNQVGTDEVTYLASYNGDVKLINYSHDR
jgi:uncharacterized lipoprotein YehR (DUF1307 family)